MVDVVRCQTSHSGHAVRVPRPQCSEEGCTREATKRGRCNRCYQRWYDSPDFVLAPPPPLPVPAPDPECLWCGPYKPNPGNAGIICPTCGLDEGEIRYAERIIADSSAVYAEEHRAYQANRAKGGP